MRLPKRCPTRSTAKDDALNAFRAGLRPGRRVAVHDLDLLGRLRDMRWEGRPTRQVDPGDRAVRAPSAQAVEDAFDGGATPDAARQAGLIQDGTNGRHTHDPLATVRRTDRQHAEAITIG